MISVSAVACKGYVQVLSLDILSHFCIMGNKLATYVMCV